MRATKIKMYSNRAYSNSLLEIDEIYITGWEKPGYYKKEYVYNYLRVSPNSIQVNVYPYPNLIPKKSINNEKYVASSPNSTTRDNLLSLPRE